MKTNFLFDIYTYIYLGAIKIHKNNVSFSISTQAIIFNSTRYNFLWS